MEYSKRKITKKKAFSLIEMITVLFISALIVAAAWNVYLVSTTIFKKNFRSAELNQNARIALERITRDIRQSSEFVTTLPLDPSMGEPPSEIIFQDGHNLGPGLLPTDGRIQYITYELVGTDLHRIVSHFSFAGADDVWVLWSARDGEIEPTETVDEDVVKAQYISQLQFWGENVITTHIQVSDAINTYTFETKTLARNVQ